MIGKRVTVVGAVTVAVLLGLCLSVGIGVAAQGQSSVEQASTTNDTIQKNIISNLSYPNSTKAQKITSKSETKSAKIYVVIAANADVINKSQIKEYGSIGTQVDRRIEVVMPQSNVASVKNISWVTNVRQAFRSEPTEIPGGSDGESLGVETIHENGITGEGVKVGIIDEGFDINNPTITSNIIDTKSFRQTVGDSAHGTSIAEIVVRTAPDSKLYLASTENLIDTEAAISHLTSKNVDVIVHSQGIPSLDDDGENTLANDVTTATESGALFVQSAGNDAQRHWEGNFSDSNFNDFHEWSSENEVNCLPNCNVDYSGDITVYIRWDDGLLDRHYEPLLFNRDTREVIQTDTDGVHTTRSGSKYTELSAEGIQSQPVGLGVKRVEGVLNDKIEVVVYGPQNIQPNTPSSSIIPPGDVSEALTVAAYQRGISRGIDGQYSRQLAPYSSRGPTDDGRTGIDVAGYTNIRVSNGLSNSPFGGTSAAAPYVGGVAALIEENQLGDSSPSKLTNKLKSSSDDILELGIDPASGSGVVNPKETVTIKNDGNSSPTQSSAKVLERTFGNNQDNSINKIISTSDGNYLLVGSDIGKDNELASIRKVTPQGSVLWKRSYSSEYNQTISDGIQTQSGNFVLAGVTETEESYTGWGLKIDKDGNKLWEIVQEDSQGIFYDVEETSNDRYLFVGEYNSSEGDDNAEVMKVASGGSKIWDFSYYIDDVRNYQDFFGIEQLETNRFVVVGQEQINGENWDGIVFKLDSNGEILSEEHYGHSVLDDWFIDVAVTENGEPVYAGTRNGVYDDEANEYNFYDGWVYYDGSTSTWSKEVTIDNLNQFSSISIDGDRIVAGGVSLAKEGSQRDGIVVEYGLDGTRNWRLTTNESGDYSIDSVLVSGNDTYVAGEINSSDSDNFDGSLRKYTTATNSTTDSQVQLTNVELSQDSISNNSESEVTLTFDALNVSSDDQQDNFTVTMPQSVELVAVTDVAVTNGNYNVSYSNTENAIRFHVNPNRDVASVDLAFEVDMTLTGRG